MVQQDRREKLDVRAGGLIGINGTEGQQGEALIFIFSCLPFARHPSPLMFRAGGIYG
ncbi:hypothetical protein [Xenorhabdus bovienii]|uniref:Uncharacterized protein n=1 Tax=Xenorhabdus bovienii str. kraussei Becker Underwood TaxID=1398204 RepID=A0A077PRX5_XENBV|nr:hypothetical protein [Xenorhabdus bovienii]CDH23496.1 hypothetical protein XBKB1_1810003 [Xenorhabdus bovienii str. kraussei Becker Underwood]